MTCRTRRQAIRDKWLMINSLAVRSLWTINLNFKVRVQKIWVIRARFIAGFCKAQRARLMA